ncbi:MAG: hypothetical protein ISS26_03350 [Candidatus Omnitrophica bacterium]|nr:hypothetical protein [Candidatus Omnitrophota bacterium]
MSIKSSIRLMAVLLLMIAGSAPQAASQDLEIFKRGHFEIYHNNRSMANKLSWKAEYHYKRILNHLGIKGFQPWESGNKCPIYIYETKSDYMQATGAPEWSQGLAEFKNLKFSSYENADKLPENTLPHEMTHMFLFLFMEKNPVPLWLNEGMAQFEEEDKKTNYRRKRFAKSLLSTSSFIPLDQLLSLTRVPEDNVELFYAQSASVVDHLINDNLRANYGRFLTGVKNGKSAEDALKESYQWKYKNGVADLEKRWLEFVRKKY